MLVEALLVGMHSIVRIVVDIVGDVWQLQTLWFRFASRRMVKRPVMSLSYQTG